MADRVNYTPSDELFNAVKGQLVARGTSFSEYCRQVGLVRQNATMALRGKSRGLVATQTVDRVISDLELDR
jgi:hypothetical protein